MNVASLPLCKTLHELSGWSDTEYHYWNLRQKNSDGEWEYTEPVALTERDYIQITQSTFGEPEHPAYDLGYLLGKLPYGIMLYKGKKGWTFSVGNTLHNGEPKAYEVLRTRNFRSETPEDAAAKLAIELFKQGVLTKEQL